MQPLLCEDAPDTDEAFERIRQMCLDIKPYVQALAAARSADPGKFWGPDGRQVYSEWIKTNYVAVCYMPDGKTICAFTVSRPRPDEKPELVTFDEYVVDQKMMAQQRGIHASIQVYTGKRYLDAGAKEYEGLIHRTLQSASVASTKERELTGGGTKDNDPIEAALAGDAASLAALGQREIGVFDNKLEIVRKRASFSQAEIERGLKVLESL